jgi:hypothetical protein
MVACVHCGRLQQLSALVEELRTAYDRQQGRAPRAARAARQVA